MSVATLLMNTDGKVKKYLVIVEVTFKSKDNWKILGKNYEVVPHLGHVVDLPKSKIGMILKMDMTIYNNKKGKQRF